MDRIYTNHADRFCYISGNVILAGRLAIITDFVKRAYHPYFGVKFGQQDKSFAPHVSCDKKSEKITD